MTIAIVWGIASLLTVLVGAFVAVRIARRAIETGYALDYSDRKRRLRLRPPPKDRR